MRTISFFLACFRLASLVVVGCLLSLTVNAQKIDKGKLDAASRRAGKATKVLSNVSALPPAEAIPKELIERSLAIAVFPDTDKVNMLLQKFMKGNGLVSRRLPGGWSTPAFYIFAVLDTGWTRVKSEDSGIIMLFMDEGTLKLFEKDRVPLVGEAGPVGELTPEKEHGIRGAGIILYAFFDGKVRGVEVDDDSTTQSGINSDNNINNAVYGLKARDVFWTNPPVGPAVPPAIIEFQNMLTTMSKQ